MNLSRIYDSFIDLRSQAYYGVPLPGDAVSWTTRRLHVKKLILALIVVTAMALSQVAVPTASAIDLELPNDNTISGLPEAAASAGNSGRVTVAPPGCGDPGSGSGC